MRGGVFIGFAACVVDIITRYSSFFDFWYSVFATYKTFFPEKFNMSFIDSFEPLVLMERLATTAGSF